MGRMKTGSRRGGNDGVRGSDLQREANSFIESFHRHNKPVTGAKFCIGASDGNDLMGVAVTGRPVARLLDDGFTAEVTRCCVRNDAPKGTPSFLYAACWRAWRAMGGTKLITYTLASEGGASLRGAGATMIAQLPGNDPKMWQNRKGDCILGTPKEWARERIRDDRQNQRTLVFRERTASFGGPFFSSIRASTVHKDH